MEPTLAQLLEQLWGIIINWKVVGPMTSLSLLSFFLVATIKNSVIRQYVWDKLGPFGKSLAAPVLSLIGVALVVNPLTPAAIFGAIVSGVGAVYLNELLNGIREWPGIKPMWAKVVEFIQNILKKKNG